MKNFTKIAITSFGTLALILGLMFNSGCVTTVTQNPDGSSSTNTVINTNLILAVEGVAVQFGTQEGVKVVIKSHPEDALYFRLASQSLKVFLNNGNYDSTTLSNVLNQTIGSKTPEILPFIADVLNVYQVADAAIVSQKIDKIVFLKQGLTSVINGIDIVVPPTP